ncbi:putative redox protein, regulator of disulfide bond formation [Belliella baltica DSM 15883]|uniref:Putative redox protein, regulator of disulfide bond formation n=1 Tax=Belliella baltica (strain DSM 15883 / CIP 108006 / LMG 21964 / BA134) TaxID=866536 RepID=I3Z4I5_BELBD|nr:OsmC family protein [Belliella baltica]AFL84153.1 putative redox protein, regulator of disulfide bond formation [Belliella baltica DSM 15883]
MPTIKSSYLGNLRTQMNHLQSGTEVITDAPLDNNGKGEAFSPTDLVAAALGSCMVTIMGIVAERDGLEMEGLSWEVTKVMNPQPRKIAEIIVEFHWENAPQDEKMLQKLKNAAKTCPVALSLHPELKQTIIFNF